MEVSRLGVLDFPSILWRKVFSNGDLQQKTKFAVKPSLVHSLLAFCPSLPVPSPFPCSHATCQLSPQMILASAEGSSPSQPCNFCKALFLHLLINICLLLHVLLNQPSKRLIVEAWGAKRKTGPEDCPNYLCRQAQNLPLAAQVQQDFMVCSQHTHTDIG